MSSKQPSEPSEPQGQEIGAFVTPFGRPSKLTREIIDEYAKVLPACLYKDFAADYLGIHRTTISRWIRRGRNEVNRMDKEGEDAMMLASEQLFVELFLVAKKAVAQSVLIDMTLIGVAAQTQWQAAAWRLERCHPEYFSTNRRELQELKKKIIEQDKKIEEYLASVAEIKAMQAKILDRQTFRPPMNGNGTHDSKPR